MTHPGPVRPGGPPPPPVPLPPPHPVPIPRGYPLRTHIAVAALASVLLGVGVCVAPGLLGLVLP